MAEWSNAHDSKSCYVGTRTEVRILFSAPNIADGFCRPLCLLWNEYEKLRRFEQAPCGRRPADWIPVMNPPLEIPWRVSL